MSDVDRATFYEFEGMRPVVHPSAFVHPAATVIGNVIIGRDVYIGPSAAIRGDWGAVVIEDGCNVQETCVIHSFPGVTVRLERGAHIGHGAVIHGAHVGSNVLIGMNAVVMDRASVGSGCIVGALTFIPADTQVPDRKVVVGNPARIVKDVSDEMLEWKTDGTRLYQELPGRLHQTLTPCEPLREVPANRREQAPVFETWHERQRPIGSDGPSAGHTPQGPTGST